MGLVLDLREVWSLVYLLMLRVLAFVWMPLFCVDFSFQKLSLSGFINIPENGKRPHEYKK